MTTRGPVVLAVVALAVALLVWVGGSGLLPGSSAPGATITDTAPPRSLDAMAESSLAAGRYDDAIRAYRQMLARAPDDASLCNELGLALHYSGRSEDALEALEKATALDPKLQRAWLSYGFVSMSIGRKTQARAALKKTVALDPSTPQGLEAKAMLAR